jgi:ribose transport system permease protein
MNKEIKKSRINLSKQAILTLFMLGVLVVLVVVVSIVTPTFLDGSNIRNVITQQSILIIVASTVTLLMITGNFDLSVGGVIGMAGVLFALLNQPSIQGGAGLSMPVAMILALLSGAILGALNAFLVVKLGIASVIATIGTMSIARGIAYIGANGSMVEVGLPLEFRFFSTTYVGPFSLPVIFMIIIVIIFIFISQKTTFGQRAYYIGANRATALLSGVRVGRITSILYVVSGLLAAFGGILLASKLGAGDSKVGTGYEFDAVVATVLGGTSIAGGEGSIIGMVVGAFIVGVLGNALNLLGVAPDWQGIAKGIVIVAAVMVQRLAVKRK